MSAAASRWLALAGMAALALLILQPPVNEAGLLAAAPLGALMLAGVLHLSLWAIATAILMLPYFSYGVMAILTDPGGRWQAIGFSILTIAIFLAALDSRRRSRAG